MKDHHRFAFDQPCFLAEQTVTNAWEKVPSRFLPVSVRLTLNIGLE